MCNWNGWQSTSMFKLYSLGARDAHGSQLTRQHMYYSSVRSTCIVWFFDDMLFSLATKTIVQPKMRGDAEEIYTQQVMWLDVRHSYGFQNEKGRLCSLLSEFDGLNHYIFSSTGHVHRFTYSAWQQFPVSSPFNSKFKKESALYMSLPQVAIHVDILRINVFWYSTG